MKLFFLRAPIAPVAAARRMRRKLGHSMWIGARQAAACRKLSRTSVNLQIVRSSSSALAMSICRSMWGLPSGANMSAISSSEKAAARPPSQSAPAVPARWNRTCVADLACRLGRSAPSLHKTAASKQERQSAEPPQLCPRLSP